MLKIGESITYISDPAVFTDAYSGSSFTLDNFSGKILILSFIEFNNGWNWFKHLSDIRRNPELGSEYQFVAVFFKSTPGRLTAQDIKERIGSDPLLRYIDFGSIDGLSICADLPDDSSFYSKYAAIYGNYIINDAPCFNLKSPGYLYYTYIASGDRICDKWHSNCTAYFITGSTVMGSPFVTLHDTSLVSAGDSVSGPGLPIITVVESVDSGTEVTLNRRAIESTAEEVFTFGSGDPVSFRRMKIDGQQPFNSRDYNNAEKYVLQRLISLKKPPFVSGIEPAQSVILNSLDKMEIIFSKPVTHDASDKTRYMLSGECAETMFIKDVSYGYNGMIENAVTVYFGGHAVTGRLSVSIDESVADFDGRVLQNGAAAAEFSFVLIPPEIASFINLSGSITCREIIKFKLSGTGTLPVTHWIVSESDIVPVQDDALWNSFKNVSTTFSVTSEFNLSPGDGVKTLYAWVKDEAGNISVVSDNSHFTLKLDTRIPEVTSFLPVMSGPTNKKRVYFTLSGLDDHAVDGWIITESGKRPEPDCAGWMKTTPEYYDLNIRESKKLELYAWAKDAVGNVSGASEFSSFTVEYDIDPPVVTDFAVEGNGYTSHRDITVKILEAADNTGISAWMITQSSTKPGPDDLAWQMEKPVQYTLNTECSSVIHLYAWAKDLAGNVSSLNKASCIKIVYDIDPPVITDFIPKNEMTGPLLKFDKLNGSDNFGITGWMITLASDKPDSSDPRWSGLKPRSFALDIAHDSTVKVYAWAKDNAGNVSSLSDNSHFKIKYISPRPVLKVSCFSKIEAAENNSNIEFADTTAGSNNLLMFALENSGDSDLIISDIIIKGSRVFTFNPSIPPMSVISSGGNSLIFGIMFNPLLVKNYRATLVIRSNDPDRDNFTIVLNGRGVSSLSVTALHDNADSKGALKLFNSDILDMGTGPAGRDINLDLYIANNGNAEISINSISMKGSSSGFKLLPLPDLPAVILPKGMIISRVVFKPGSVKKLHSAVLTVKSSDTLCRNFSFTVKIKTTGKAAPGDIEQPGKVAANKRGTALKSDADVKKKHAKKELLQIREAKPVKPAVKKSKNERNSLKTENTAEAKNKKTALKNTGVKLKKTAKADNSSKEIVKTVKPQGIKLKGTVKHKADKHVTISKKTGPAGKRVKNGADIIPMAGKTADKTISKPLSGKIKISEKKHSTGNAKVTKNEEKATVKSVKAAVSAKSKSGHSEKSRISAKTITKKVSSDRKKSNMKPAVTKSKKGVTKGKSKLSDPKEKKQITKNKNRK